MSHDPAPNATPAEPQPAPSVVQLPGTPFVIACVLAAVGVLALGRFVVVPTWVLAAEVFATILALFLLGSFKYQLHKNPLTYGMGVLIFATFMAVWWGQNNHRGAFVDEEKAKIWEVFRDTMTWRGLDDLVHLDTMLFILGLTFFVSVVAQTRLLEEISFWLLRRNRGRVMPTALAIVAVVAVASGIFDGVSMIGLTIRVLVIILTLAAAPVESIRYAVMVCTAVTTICGVWLAYGEPPNLIMKANLHPHLDNMFFLRYCAPAAVLAFLCIAWNLRGKLRGQRVDLDSLDVIDANAATVRFLQANRHGEVLSAVEFAHSHAGELGPAAEPVARRLRAGEALGLAMVRENVDPRVRQKILGGFTDERLADSLDRHYVLDAAGDHAAALEAETRVDEELARQRRRRIVAQRFGLAAIVPFVAMLVVHGVDHRVPLCLASLAGFAVALMGIVSLPKVRSLAFREAMHEYAEYYFLFPLFLSITLLKGAGFFSQLQQVFVDLTAAAGPGHVAWLQFAGATFLSAILDNNVVADFASHALHGMAVALIHLFAMAQIAGYATGGCWTHIGCAQSVVAYAYIQRDVDPRYTPLQWIKEMTPVLISICVALTVLIYVEAWLLPPVQGPMPEEVDIVGSQ